MCGGPGRLVAVLLCRIQGLKWLPSRSTLRFRGLSFRMALFITLFLFLVSGWAQW